MIILEATVLSASHLPFERTSKHKIMLLLHFTCPTFNSQHGFTKQQSVWKTSALLLQSCLKMASLLPLLLWILWSISLCKRELRAKLSSLRMDIATAEWVKRCYCVKLGDFIFRIVKHAAVFHKDTLLDYFSFSCISMILLTCRLALYSCSLKLLYPRSDSETLKHTLAIYLACKISCISKNNHIAVAHHTPFN